MSYLAAQLLIDADEMEGWGAGNEAKNARLAARQLRAKDDIIGMLRAQLRMCGLVPCVQENEAVGKAEYAMLRRAGN